FPVTFNIFFIVPERKGPEHLFAAYEIDKEKPLRCLYAIVGLSDWSIGTESLLDMRSNLLWRPDYPACFTGSSANFFLWWGFLNRHFGRLATIVVARNCVRIAFGAVTAQRKTLAGAFWNFKIGDPDLRSFAHQTFHRSANSGGDRLMQPGDLFSGRFG